jgi:hypothetical protein
MSTTQEAHDQIVRYFSQPGARLSKLTDEEHDELFDGDPNAPTCWYRHPLDPTVMCGVGILIPPDVYSRPRFESRPVLGLIDGFDKRLSEHLAGVSRGYLDRVQKMHDTSETVEEFLGKLRSAAEEFGLDHPDHLPREMAYIIPDEVPVADTSLVGV